MGGLISVGLFGIGLILGSFINVVVFRTVHGFSPWAGRSFCPKCKRKIAWYDNIPLLSFVALGGKCRYCRRPISLQYPVIELLTVGRLAFRLAEQPYSVIQPGFWLAVGLGLVLLTGFDLFYGVLPDFVVGILGGITLIYRLSLAVTGIMRWSDFWGYLGAGLAGAAVLAAVALATRGRGMGWGDVKLAGVMGLILGPSKLLVAVAAAVLTGAVAAVILVVTGRKQWGQTVPFGPFLTGGTLVALLWGEAIWRWYGGLLGLPF
jgi:prepilin signal peptidase PulO-like enzyme (type II secretory pathway)